MHLLRAGESSVVGRAHGSARGAAGNAGAGSRAARTPRRAPVAVLDLDRVLRDPGHRDHRCKPRSVWPATMTLGASAVVP